jgi:hypothetical protein
MGRKQDGHEIQTSQQHNALLKNRKSIGVLINNNIKTQRDNFGNKTTFYHVHDNVSNFHWIEEQTILVFLKLMFQESFSAEHGLTEFQEILHPTWKWSNPYRNRLLISTYSNEKAKPVAKNIQCPSEISEKDKYGIMAKYLQQNVLYEHDKPFRFVSAHIFISVQTMRSNSGTKSCVAGNVNWLFC